MKRKFIALLMTATLTLGSLTPISAENITSESNIDEEIVIDTEEDFESQENEFDDAEDEIDDAWEETDTEDGDFDDSENLMLSDMGDASEAEEFIGEDFFQDSEKNDTDESNVAKIIKSGTLFGGGEWTLDDEGVYKITGKGTEIYYAAEDKENLKVVEVEGEFQCLSNDAFKNCRNLSSIKLPDKLIIIEEEKVDDNDTLNSTEQPKEVLIIGTGAFYGCSSLNSIKLPGGVTNIGDEAFYGCSSLNSIELPNELKSIGARAFYGCSKLNKIELPDGVTSIGDEAFCNCSSLSSIKLPSNLTNIGDRVFEGCNNLKDVDALENTDDGNDISQDKDNTENKDVDKSERTIIDSGSFGENVTWTLDDEGVVIISGTGVLNGSGLLDSDSNIEKIIVENGITDIKRMPFNGEETIKEIQLPDSLISIDHNAFGFVLVNGFKGVSSIRIPKNVSNIGISKENLFLSIKGLAGLEYIDVDPENQFFCSVDGCLYSKDMKTLISIPHMVTDLKVPDGVQEIVAYAQAYGRLTKIELPESLISIGDGAFEYCPITQISLPDNVEMIGEYAFYDSSLQEIKLSKNLKSIENGAFRYTEIKKLTLPITLKKADLSDMEELEEITIPDGLEDIILSMSLS